MNDYFAREYLGASEKRISTRELIQKIRDIGFDFPSDEDALEHFLSEVKELKRAYETGDTDEIAKESADVLWMLEELTRRRGVVLRDGEEAVREKNLRRLAYIEERLDAQGKSWGDASYQDELKPLWDEAKEAGL